MRKSLGRAADIADIRIRTQTGEFRFHTGGEQSLVNADVSDSGFRDFLVERVHQLFVVGMPWKRRCILMRVVADGVAFP